VKFALGESCLATFSQGVSYGEVKCRNQIPTGFVGI